MEHRNIPRGEFHGVANWSVASTAERDVLTVSDADIGKQCWVRGTGHFVLAAASPMTWEAATIAVPTVSAILADATAYGVWATAHADDAEVLNTFVYVTDVKATYFVTAVTPAVVSVLVGETPLPYVTYADAAAFAAATPTIDVLGKVARVADTDSFYYCKVHGATPQWVSLSPVTSVFGRTGAVTAQNGDYTAAQVGADAAGSAAAAQAAAVQRANHTGTQLAATISDFNATASAAAPVQSVNGNTGIVTVAEGDSREVRKTQAYWCEDFISYYTRLLAAPVTPTGFSSTTAEDEQQWCIGGTQDAIGVVTLIPTASTVYATFSASSHALAGGAGGLVLTGKTIDATWSFCQKKATASDEGFVVCAGFGVAVTGAWSASYPRIGFRTYDNAGVHTWEFITSTGGTSTTSTITWATSGCAQNTRITCRAVITAASVLFYINGTLHATHTTNIPTTQLPDQIWHAYANLGFTDTSYGVSIDYMDKLTTLDSPRAL